METTTKAKRLLGLTYDVEGIVRHRVATGFAHRHVENTITENLLTELNDQLHEVELTDLSTSTKILCEAYKYSGAAETAYGDIAVLVKIHYPDKTLFEGIGFLEAKKRDISGNGFGAFKLDQIQRIYQNAPHSFVLMYDQKSIKSDFVDVDVPYRMNCKMCFPPPIDTHAAVVANNVILRGSTLDTSLYKYSLPFSYQFCYRYLLGLDLNFSRSAAETAEKFVKSLPQRYVMTINVFRGVQPPDNFQMGLFEDDHYSVLRRNLEG